VVPTTALLLSHAYTADRRQVAKSITGCLRDGELFSLLYRIVDAAGQLRWALIAGEGTFDSGGAVTGIRGYLIDVTEPQTRAKSREVASVLRKAIASRARIEQAKGALMLIYGLDAEAAFALLSWQSQRSNVKLRGLAERLVATVGGDTHAPAAIRQRLDEIIYNLPTVPATAAAPAPRPADDDLLTVQQEVRDGAVVLRLSGEIDMSAGPLLDRHLARAVAAVIPPTPLVADLSRVQHLGPIGVALLTAYHRRCLAARIPLRVVAGNGPTASILSMIPIGLELHDRLADAVPPGPDPAGRHMSPGSLSERRSEPAPLRSARTLSRHWSRPEWTSTAPPPARMPTISRSPRPASAAAGTRPGSSRPSGRPRT
jgi:anti-anti-sigma factor